MVLVGFSTVFVCLTCFFCEVLVIFVVHFWPFLKAFYLILFQGCKSKFQFEALEAVKVCITDLEKPNGSVGNSGVYR